MDQNKKGLNKKQQKTLTGLFLKTVGITLAVCIVLVGGGMAAYYGFIYNPMEASTTVDVPLTEEEQQKEDEKKQRSLINKTIAVFGIDQDETRTDVIMVVNFNSKTNKVKVVSVPRDTKVDWTTRQQEKLRQLKGYSRSVSKINEMTAYSGMENIRDFTIDEIENILGIKIDNYVVVNTAAFRDIVDAIGGVEVDVPMRMYYTDKSQDLYIDLQQGVQLLNGRQAEGLVRFRYGYKEGDVGRIETQKIFLKAFAEKVLSPAVVKGIPSIVTSLFTHVKTDMKLTDIMTYLSYMNTFDVGNLSFYTVPGEGAYQGDVSYYFINQGELNTLIEDVFYDTEVAGNEVDDTSTEDDPLISDEEEEMVINKKVTIEIYNATGQKGLAGGLKHDLEEVGYKVDSIDNYTKQDLDKTIIYAKDIKLAEQFKEYLPSSATILKSTSLQRDIQIILGKDFLE